MKISQTLLIAGGLLPGIAIGLVMGWAMKSRASSDGNPVDDYRNSERSGVSSDSTSSGRNTRRNRGRYSGNHVTQMDTMPSFDLIMQHEGTLDEVSVLMRFRIHNEVARLQSGDFPSVMERAKLSDGWSGEMVSLLLIRWAEIDPAAAMAFGQANFNDENMSFSSFDESDWRILISTVDLEMNGDNAITSLEKSLQNENAEDWWDTHSEDMDMFSLYSLRATRDPEVVFESLMGRGEDAFDSEAPWMGLIDGCFKADKLPWLLGRIDACEEDTRSNLRYGLASQWARRDISEAKKWAEKLLAEGEDDVIDEVADEWSSSDPKAAGDWILSLPSSENRHEQAMRCYVSADLDEALQWLDKNVQSDVSWDGAKMQALAGLYQKARYKEAFERLPDFSNKGAHNDALRRIFESSRWGDHGGKAAEVGKLAEEFGYGDAYNRYRDMRKKADDVYTDRRKIERAISKNKWLEPEE